MSRTCEISIRRSRGRHTRTSLEQPCLHWWAQKGDSSTAWRIQQQGARGGCPFASQRLATARLLRGLLELSDQRFQNPDTQYRSWNAL